MSTIVPSNFPAFKVTAENPDQLRKSAKSSAAQSGLTEKGVLKKSFATQPTPRKALGDISNSRKTSRNGLKNVAPLKPKVGASQPRKRSTSQKPVTEDFPDIEHMPPPESTGVDPPFVPPPYFSGIAAALMSTGLPPFDFSAAHTLSSLHLDVSQPRTKFGVLQADFEEFDAGGLDGLAQVDLPDLSDL